MTISDGNLFTPKKKVEKIIRENKIRLKPIKIILGYSPILYIIILGNNLLFLKIISCKRIQIFPKIV
jgi:hypothetical protein